MDNPVSGERPALQHPLPEEIRKMQRDDTVCKFCGVSYLIHNEIKNLEDKLKAAEDELKHYRGMEEREEDLKYEMRKLNLDLEAAGETILAKDSIIGTLNASLDLKDDEIRIIENTRKLIENKLGEMSANLETYKLKHGLLMTNLPSIINEMKLLRESGQSIKELVKERDTVLTQECATIHASVSKKCSNISTEFEKLNSRVLLNQTKCEEAQMKQDEMKVELENAQRHNDRLNNSEVLQEKLTEECQALKRKIQSLEKELESAVSAQRNLSMESEQYKEQIKKHSQEMEQLQAQYRNREAITDQQIDKLKKELNQKEFDVDSAKKDVSGLRRRLDEKQRLEHESQKIASSSNVKVEEMREQMQRAQGDAEALKREREMMITAHQNQIEQLRESFRNRMAEADKWPERMEETIRKERDRHVLEVEALEIKFKENFVLELQIEKQKHQELVEQYLSEGKENEQKLKSQLQGIGSKHKSEIGELHKQIAETKARSRETENSVRKEVESLKSILRDLEGRLGRVNDGVGQEKLLGIKTQLIETQTELDNTNQECKKLDTQLATAREEISFLQDTVRRECEERFQLTEALALCKEDLLAYRKPPGGYSSRPGSGHGLEPRSASTAATRSEEMALYKKAAARVPQPPHAPKSAFAGGSLKDTAPPPNVSMGFDGEGAKTTGKGGVKGGTLSEQRKRIAHAVGRN